jgi:hypothetical protein
MQLMLLCAQNWGAEIGLCNQQLDIKLKTLIINYDAHRITVSFLLFPSSGILKITEHRTMEKVQNPSNSVCYTPSSEPFKMEL